MRTMSYFILMFVVVSCSKDSTNSSSSLYTPTGTDVTANATLDELLQGRTLYINHCGDCHGLYSPDGRTVSEWKSAIAVMGPRTSLTAAEITLVTKYLCRGKQ
jgi:hypothetical protein